MADISVYSFEDKDDNEYGTWTTQNYQEAREHARKHELRLMENIYEWQERVPVEGDDYTGEPSKEVKAAIYKLSREEIVSLLEGEACIACYDSESLEKLQEALRVNVGDGTIAEESVLALVEER